MKLYGLIGFPLTHSFSENYFTEKFQHENINDCAYKTFPLEDISEFTNLTELISELQGLNVTIPYKEKIIPYLDELSDNAKEIGAVNTIKFIRRGLKIILKGYNTDYYGFLHSLKPFLTSNHKKALVLGTGGASKAVIYTLEHLGIKYTLVSRTVNNEENNFTITYNDLTENIIKENLIIINTTPLGMFPLIDSYPPIPYEFINKTHILYDLIYNPHETQFLKFGRHAGAVTINGLKMLHTQAERAWEIFNSDIE